jgi:hypothetical protein
METLQTYVYWMVGMDTQGETNGFRKINKR